MSKFQIRWNSDLQISSNEIEDYLLHKNKDDIKVIFKNGNTLRYLGHVSLTKIEKELEKRFNEEFEVRQIN
ncbi:hypothetical protein [Candidatus Hepatoplasma crinochetorum]|jgi:hypothetical protein|uniref:Uncharacterized protein n=1 Tax=Candidatus Hepatoplasma crinochetorum Av TaxID=1427984 RepID=W8GT59_9MOLU|nr:hypothetical protein [Candidatus Hepatoplasma crinochetorum]AHK22615.1 hypothetical protein X271_00515 [Candidatus Hepatoplasma crinochetorum Av]BDV03197.1 MAG: hypothetical protein HCTKY_4910 [Candidatus Hepatoplasma crinochetorum]